MHNSLDIAMLLHWDDGDAGQATELSAGTHDWTTTLNVDSVDAVGPDVGGVLVALPPATSSSNVTCDIYIDGVHAATSSGQTTCNARNDLSRLTGKPSPVGT